MFKEFKKLLFSLIDCIAASASNQEIFFDYI